METKSLIPLIFLHQAIINCVNPVIAQTPRPTQQTFKCSNKGNFKSDALLKDRDNALDILSRRIRSTKPYTGHETGESDGIWTIALCPPNIKMETCQECVNNTIPYLKKNCPKQKEGVAWTVLSKLNCMVRYADFQIQANLAEWAWAILSTPPNQTPTNASELEKGLNNLANKLKEAAAGGDNLRKYGSGSVTYGSVSRTLYGSMQCTPDIGKPRCMKCLSDATNAIHSCCSKERKLAGITFSTNCYFWYSHSNFLPRTPQIISAPSQ